MSATLPFICITCKRGVQEQILDSFFPNLFVMLSAFIAVGFIVTILGVLASRKFSNPALQNNASGNNPVPLVSSAMVLGIGLGGFADGILLHQVFQFHEMLSAQVAVDTVDGKSVNLFWDGIFHMFCLLIVITGMLMYGQC